MTDKEMLKKLIDEKKEIERKIREIRGKEIAVGRVKLDKYTCGICDEYFVAVKRINVDNLRNYEPRYMPIIVAKEKFGAMEAIADVICDLRNLYEKIYLSEVEKLCDK